MKAVLISIRPEWCEKIANGEKTIEVRKSRPKLEPPFKCYIYQTKKPVSVSFSGTGPHISEYDKTYWYNEGSGKVIGEFVCDGIYAVLAHPSIFAGHPLFFAQAIQDACLTEEEVEVYSGGKDVCGWHISDLVIYDKPKDLSEFWRPCPERNELGPNCWDCENRCGDDEVDCNTSGKLYLSRPPQSWCYVEDLDND